MQIDAVLDGGDAASLSLENGRVFLRRHKRWTQSELANRHPSDVEFIGTDTIVIAGYIAVVDDPALLDDFRDAVEQVIDENPKVESGGEAMMHPALRTPLDSASPRWQYAVVNVGAFNSSARMATVLGEAGAAGWELVTVFDKASNWFASMEKGFILLKREVPSGVDPGEWGIEYRG